jgi:hypothetical protein
VIARLRPPSGAVTYSLRQTARMKVLLYMLLVSTAAVPQTQVEDNNPPNWNIPRIVWHRFKVDQILERYAISMSMNPFYLAATLMEIVCLIMPFWS